MEKILDFGDVVLPNWTENMEMARKKSIVPTLSEHGYRAAFMLDDITYVRTWVRNYRRGEHIEGRADGYRVNVIWPNGDEAEWQFDTHVGWPLEGGVKRDWHSEWLAINS